MPYMILHEIPFTVLKYYYILFNMYIRFILYILCI